MKRRKAKKMCECGTLIKVEGTDCVFMSLGFVRNGCIDSFNGIDIRKRELISRCSGKGRLATKKESLIYWSVMKEYLAGGCYKGCKIPKEEAIRQVKDSKKYKVLFADLDGTLIDTVSGETFPRGIWDMKFRLEVLDKIKELNLEFLLIVTNQGGIEKGFVDENEFQCKSEYVSRAIREYCGCKVHSMYCTSNDKDDKYRKPNVGMLDLLCENYVGDDFEYIKSKSLMIGDASGKPGQFSDSDKKCAENFGIDYLDVEDFLQTIFKEETK